MVGCRKLDKKTTSVGPHTLMHLGPAQALCTTCSERQKHDTDGVRNVPRYIYGLYKAISASYMLIKSNTLPRLRPTSVEEDTHTTE